MNKMWLNWLKISILILLFQSCYKDDELKTGYYNLESIVHRNNLSDTLSVFKVLGPYKMNNTIVFTINNQSSAGNYYFELEHSDCKIRQDYSNVKSYLLNSFSMNNSQFKATVTPKVTSDTSSLELTFNFIE